MDTFRNYSMLTAGIESFKLQPVVRVKRQLRMEIRQPVKATRAMLAKPNPTYLYPLVQHSI
jgi:hypothetical protein